MSKTKPLASAFAVTLEDLREGAGMTTADLAAVSGIDRRYLEKLERGNICQGFQFYGGSAVRWAFLLVTLFGSSSNAPKLDQRSHVRNELVTYHVAALGNVVGFAGWVLLMPKVAPIRCPAGVAASHTAAA